MWKVKATVLNFQKLQNKTMFLSEFIKLVQQVHRDSVSDHAQKSNHTEANIWVMNFKQKDMPVLSLLFSSTRFMGGPNELDVLRRWLKGELVQWEVDIWTLVILNLTTIWCRLKNKNELNIKTHELGSYMPREANFRIIFITYTVQTSN